MKRLRQIRSDNCSGVRGVSIKQGFDPRRGKYYPRAQATWVDENGNRQYRSFSINVFGYEGAVTLAEAARLEGLRR